MKFTKLLTILLLTSCFLYNCKQQDSGTATVITQPADTTKTGVVKNTSYTTKGGERVMQMEMIVESSVETLWNMHTNSTELQTFMAPVIEVDFTVGGKWEASYDLNAKIGNPDNIINEVVAYIPYRMLAIRTTKAPPGYASDEVLKSLIATIEFQNLGNGKVKVIESVIGWKNKEEFNKLWDVSLKANMGLFDCLQVRLKKGPLDWPKVLATY